MTNRVIQLGGLAATVLTLAASAYADIKLNDNFMINGYAAGSYEYTKWKGADATDSLFNGTNDTPSADAVKMALNMTFKPVTGVISLYYIPNYPTNKATNQLTVLDAYVTYDAGQGVTITAGKFLSWMGYEAFDTVNMAQITYGAPTVGGLAAIPAYHTGIKAEFSNAEWGSGVAVVDSVYSPYGYDRGDGELIHNAGFEAYLTYKGVKDFTLWGGLVYDTAGNFEPHSIWMLDVWAQYAVNKQITVAGEVTYTDKGTYQVGSGEDAFWVTPKGWDYLLYFNYAFDDKTSLVLRFSGENPESNAMLPKYQQYTVGPSYAVTANLTVRAEYSYYHYDNGASKNFLGVQGIFKF